jgi:hypothetical protein
MLTEPQLQTLKADITANFLAQWNAGDLGAIVVAYNAVAAPDFYVWRTSVTRDEIMAGNFDWTQADNLTAGQARIWDWLFANEARAIDASKVNVRAGVSECWKGTAAKVAVATATLNVCMRLATRLEKLFAVGTGSNADPATMATEHLLDTSDVVRAMGS